MFKEELNSNSKDNKKNKNKNKNKNNKPEEKEKEKNKNKNKINEPEKNKEINYNITKLNYETKEELMFSIIIDGAQNTGRTSIVEKFIDIDNSNNKNNKQGLGYINSYKYIKIEDTIVKLDIIDYTINNISKRSITNYKNANLIMLVYSIDNYTSFEKLESKIYSIQSKSKYFVFLIGNKNDLEKREVSEKDVEIFVNNNNINYFKEVSAKTGNNIDDIFFEAVKVLYKNRKPIKQQSKQFGHKGNDGNKNKNNNALNFLFPA